MECAARTLSDVQSSAPRKSHSGSREATDTRRERVGVPPPPDRKRIECAAPYCRQRAEWVVPQGMTPRTMRSDFPLCGDCVYLLIDRVATSIVLEGEPCEWELTLHHLENIHDGGHDFRRNLLIESCSHRVCLARRASASTASTPRNSEVSA